MERSDKELVCKLTERGIRVLGLKNAKVGDRVFVHGYWNADGVLYGGDLFLEGLFGISKIGRILQIGGDDAGLELE